MHRIDFRILSILFIDVDSTVLLPPITAYERLKIDRFSTLLAERHHFRLPVAERVKRFIGVATGASASKALTASATIKQACVDFWW